MNICLFKNGLTLILFFLVIFLSNSATFGADMNTVKETPVKITVAGKSLSAIFYNNETSRSLIRQFPLTITMMNLYGREMCHRFQKPLPANETRASEYEVGEIAYWPPRHSFVIFYKQNGEIIDDLQKIGKIQGDLTIFEKLGDTPVKFEIE